MSPADRARAASAVRASAERDTEHEPRRLTPTERLHELAMAHATRPTAAPEHALGLVRNAKGVTQIDLMVRGTDLDEVLAQGFAAYDSARSRYPLPSGYVGAEGEPAGGAK